MLKLDQAVVESSVGSFQKAFNEQTLEVFGNLAAALKEEESSGGNAIITQALENCRKFQGLYNTCLASFKGFVKDAEGIAEIADYVKKVTMGDVNNHDTSFHNSGIDVNDVRM